MARIGKVHRVRYTDPAGRRCSPTAPGSTKHIETSRIFYAFNAIPGSRRPIPLATTLEASQAKLARILAGVEEAKKPPTLAARFTDWEEALAISGTTQDWQRGVTTMARSILKEAGAMAGTAIDAGAVRRVFAARVKNRPRWSAQTQANSLRALNQFLRWAELPCVRMKLPAPRVNRVFKRTALSMEQAAQLLNATRKSKRLFRGLTGIERERMYRLILTTGLRRGELMALTGAHLAGHQIILEPGEEKNRRGNGIDLGPALAAEVAAIRGKWFPGEWHDRSAKMVRLDLAEAGVTIPGHFDLHCLRHTFITWCARRFGVEITQRLARHSTSVLTLDYYTHAHPDHIAAAAGQLEENLALLGCVPGCAKRSKKSTLPKPKTLKSPQKKYP